MTTIAYSDGKLYADSRAYSGSNRPIGQKSKIHRIKNGIVAGSSNDAGTIERIRDIVEEHGVSYGIPDKLDATVFFVETVTNDFRPEEKRIKLWGYFSGPAWVELDSTDTLFIGSGASYALGANIFADTVEDAMRAAIDLDMYSGLPLVVVSAK